MNTPAKITVSICLVSTLLSAINPLNYSLWFFEIFAGLVGVLLICINNKKYPLTHVLYVIITIHFVALAVAAKYSYADMPLFNWIRDEFGLSRNYYDRVGHFMQGLTPAILSRELLLRNTAICRGKMLGFICIAIALAFSAFWEILEWLMAVTFYPEKTQEWLGMQGDIFDAQGDMLMAMCGAVLAMMLLSKIQDRHMATIHNWGAGVMPDQHR